MNALIYKFLLRKKVMIGKNDFKFSAKNTGQVVHISIVEAVMFPDITLASF